MNYVATALGVLLIFSLIGNKILWSKYEETKHNYIQCNTNQKQLKSDLEYQNQQISKMKIDTEKFRQEYSKTVENVIQEKVETIRTHNVNTCEDILTLIEKEL